MDIFLTNNLSNKKEQFVPKGKKNVGMYVCGPTVYDDPHIGNARPLVIFDILFKLLKNEFPSVTYVRNITDIDDKIIKSSQEQKISTKELTEKVTSSFQKDCEFLNCENPTHQPKATEHIDLMIEMITELIEKGFAYENKKDGSAVVSEVTDHDDWKTVRNELIRNTGINMIPHIYIDRVDSDGALVLKHEHDGRDLDLDYADKVMDHIREMWDKEVKLFTIIEEEVWEI